MFCLENCNSGFHVSVWNTSEVNHRKITIQKISSDRYLVICEVSFLPRGVALFAWTVSWWTDFRGERVEKSVGAAVCRYAYHQLVSIRPKLHVVVYSVILYTDFLFIKLFKFSLYNICKCKATQYMKSYRMSGCIHPLIPYLDNGWR